MSNIYNNSIFRFIIVGGTATFVDFVIYIILLNQGVDVVVAKAISVLIAMSISYFLNKKWTFNNVYKKRERELLRFAMTQIANFSVNVSVNYICVSITNNVIIGFVVATGIATSVNFLLQRFWVFGGRK